MNFQTKNVSNSYHNNVMAFPLVSLFAREVEYDMPSLAEATPIQVEGGPPESSVETAVNNLIGKQS